MTAQEQPAAAPRSGLAAPPPRVAAGRARQGLVRAGMRLIPWAVAIAIWELVTQTHLVNPGLVPTPVEVLQTFWDRLVNDRLWLDIYMSCERVLIGLACGIVAAIPVAFVLGWYRGARKMIDPLINFFRSLPPIALIPLVIVYFGIDEVAKVVMLFYASFFSGVIVMYEGILQTNPLYVRVARTFGATDREIFWRIIVPLSIPHVLTALRVALGISWATLVAAELIAARHGLGAVIENAANYFQLTTIYMGIICIGVIALAMDSSLRLIAARIVRWQDRLPS
jgi:NitT/TauT family transport system permease protein